jgi:hypothetical protein
LSRRPLREASDGFSHERSREYKSSSSTTWVTWAR